MVVRENPCRSAVFEILRTGRLAPTTIPCLKSLKSLFFPILMLGLNFSMSYSPHLECIELLPCDWLINNLFYQAIEQVYLIKWPVSVYVSFWRSVLPRGRICQNLTFFYTGAKPTDTFKTVPVPKQYLNRYLCVYIYIYIYIYIKNTN